MSWSHRSYLYSWWNARRERTLCFQNLCFCWASCVHLLLCWIWNIAPFPIVIFDPIWLKSGCTANAASNHVNLPLLSDGKHRQSSFVPFKNNIILLNLFLSSSVGSLTLVHKNAIAVIMSGLALFVKNNPFATIVWNSSLLCSLNFVLSSYT